MTFFDKFNRRRLYITVFVLSRLIDVVVLSTLIIAKLWPFVVLWFSFQFPAFLAWRELIKSTPKNELGL